MCTAYPAAPVSATERVAVLSDRLIDGRNDRPLRDAAVIVEGERIVAVGGRDIVPDGVQGIELGDSTLEAVQNVLQAGWTTLRPSASSSKNSP